VQEKPFYKRWLFNKGINSKLYYLEKEGQVQHKYYDNYVFKQAKEKLGGNVKVIITGSAPISENVLNFLKCLFCCPIVEGYG
jgi:long-chain acyl-CoA synthetase